MPRLPSSGTRVGLAARSYHRQRSGSPSPDLSCRSSSKLSCPFQTDSLFSPRTVPVPSSPRRRPLSGSVFASSPAVARPVPVPVPVPPAFPLPAVAVPDFPVSFLLFSHLFVVPHCLLPYFLFSPLPQPAVPQPPSRHFLFSPPPQPAVPQSPSRHFLFSPLPQPVVPQLAGTPMYPPCAERAVLRLPQGLSAGP